MTDRQHGGYRRPRAPAAVSTPQSGARTDGGAADPQGVRVASGGPYGSRQATVNQQQAAPLPTQQVPPVGGGSPAARPAPAPPTADIFGPTQHPTRPIGPAPSPPPTDPRIVLRQLYAEHPDPWIAQLLRMLG